MRTVLRLIPWLVLACVAGVATGLWGLLAVALLYALCYVLFPPRARVAATPEQLAAAREEEERRNVDLAAAVFNRAAKASSEHAAKPKGGPAGL